MKLLVRLAAALACALASRHASALDKQGSAHGGDTEDHEHGSIDISGALTYGISLYNPTYAARPDNSGHALFRYAGHADIDLIGRRLSIPVDVSMFTDRDRKGVRKLGPTELDVISGLTTTWQLATGHALELGSRVEHDRPLDQGTFTQTYVDSRARYLYSVAHMAPDLGKALGNGDVSGAATLGLFAYNPTYAARPDNSGLALLRYALRTELSLADDVISLAVDGTFFTDRKHRPLSPSELDLTFDLIGRVAPFEVHLAYERDMPLDRAGTAPGYTQSFVYLLLVWSFDAYHETKPLLDRGSIPSP